MQKVKSSRLNAGMLSKNFKDRVKQFIASDDAFSFMNSIKGTPAYWEKILQEVLAMVKQLGLPTFFLTLSCADLRWNELISIISKLNKLSLNEEEIKSLAYQERCRLNMNPVLVARHVQGMFFINKLFQMDHWVKLIIMSLGLSFKYVVVHIFIHLYGLPILQH